MGTTKAFLTGTILGAGAAYFFDSRMGNRRRVLIEDKLRRFSHRSANAVDAGIRDLENRAQGALHNVGSLLGPSSPAAQRPGAGARPGGRFKWSPGPRLLVAACGTALMGNCLARRTPVSLVLGTLGFGMFAQAMSGGRRGIAIERTIGIDAPVDAVYQFFANPENYLRISDVITNVRVFGDGRFAKDLTIAGVPLRFEERFVRMEQSKVLETHSEPGSALEYSKQMRFESLGEHQTRVQVHFSYHPPGGMIGHAAAAILGLDPKSLLADLLVRAKYFLESGREPHDAVARRRRLSAQGDGSQKQPEEHEVLRGTGAPVEDVQVGSGLDESPSPWPPASSPGPETAETSGRFPTPLD